VPFFVLDCTYVAYGRHNIVGGGMNLGFLLLIPPHTYHSDALVLVLCLVEHNYK